MIKKRERDGRHKEEMKARMQILRAQWAGYREIIYALEEMGLVIPALEERFKKLEALTPEIWRRMRGEEDGLREDGENRKEGEKT